MIAVLVGGAGLIGHSIALEMASRGWEPVIIDSLEVNNLYALDDDQTLAMAMVNERLGALNKAGVPLIISDARKFLSMETKIRRIKPDIILHLAAISHIDRANRYPHTTFEHCEITLANSLEIASTLETRFVYFSSSTVYGDWTKEVLDEESELKPKGTYGKSKLRGEIHVEEYRDTHGLPTTIIRPCALYGPRCISRRVVQIFVENAFWGKPITVMGGDQKEDFTYIDDLVDGVMRVCENERAIGETFNITGGHARSLQELLEIIIDLTNPGPSSVTYTEKDPEKPHRGTMSVQKASNLLGYRPSYSLEEGISAYLEWYAAFDKRYEAQHGKRQTTP